MATIDIDKKSSYITLRIGSENFAINVSVILEIILFEKLTKVPNASDFIQGVLNFRGAIIPVIDMHKRFNMQVDLTTTDKMVVVANITGRNKSMLIGLLVDQVTDIIEFEYKNIKSVPDLCIKYNPEFLEGFIEKDGQFIMVLNIDRVLNTYELAETAG